MSKKILVVSKAFYPQNSPRSFRTTELVKEFARLGHDVTIYIPKDDRFHIQFEKKYEVTIKDLGKSKFRGISMNSGGKYYILLKRLVRRILDLLFHYPNIEYMFKTHNILKKENGYDLLITVAVPHSIHWGTAWARTTKNQIATKWVADCGDPFYFNIHDSFKTLFYFKYLEKWFSRKADYISIPFEGLKKYFFKEFETKYRVIPQGFNFEEIEVYTKPVKNDVITFAYAGGFIKGARDPGKFLNFLQTVDKPFRFIVYNEQSEFTDHYKTVFGDKLVVKDYIPRNKLFYELSKMDFLVNFEYDITNQSPSKLIDYTLTKRPILLVEKKEFDENRILEFLDKNYNNQFKLPNIDNYNIKNVSKQFLNLIEQY